MHPSLQHFLEWSVCFLPFQAHLSVLSSGSDPWFCVERGVWDRRHFGKVDCEGIETTWSNADGRSAVRRVNTPYEQSDSYPLRSQKQEQRAYSRSVSANVRWPSRWRHVFSLPLSGDLPLFPVPWHPAQTVVDRQTRVFWAVTWTTVGMGEQVLAEGSRGQDASDDPGSYLQAVFEWDNVPILCPAMSCYVLLCLFERPPQLNENWRIHEHPESSPLGHAVIHTFAT